MIALRVFDCRAVLIKRDGSLSTIVSDVILSNSSSSALLDLNQSVPREYPRSRIRLSVVLLGYICPPAQA